MLSSGLLLVLATQRPPKFTRKTLAGSFVDAPREYDDGIPDEPGELYLETEESHIDNKPAVWSRRSAAANNRWADPEKREETLRKRRATAAVRGKTSASTSSRRASSKLKRSRDLDKFLPEDATAAEKRSRAMRLKWSNERQWFMEKMQASEQKRLERTDPAAMAERQKRRSDAMKKAWERRRAKSDN